MEDTNECHVETWDFLMGQKFLKFDNGLLLDVY